MLVLALQEVVEDDFQRPGLEQSCDALSSDSEQTQPQLATVRPQQFKDVQTTSLCAHCLRVHAHLDADPSTCGTELTTFYLRLKVELHGKGG
jgi:hypothetical protein